MVYVLERRRSPWSSKKNVNFDVFLLCTPSCVLFTCIHDNAKVLVQRIWDRFPVFLALAPKISQFYITYYIEITCHFRNWSPVTTEIVNQSSCKGMGILGSNRMGIAIGNAWRLLVLKVRRDLLRTDFRLKILLTFKASMPLFAKLTFRKGQFLASVGTCSQVLRSTSVDS